MITVCSYCKTTMEEKPPLDDGVVSHGICGVCFDYYLPPILEMDFSTHLNEYPEPVVMVDVQGRVMGINTAMSGFLKKEPGEALGLLGGELLHCRHASEEGGCGKTQFCASCSFRGAFERAQEEQADVTGVKVSVDSQDGRVWLQVSCFPRPAFTKVVVDEVISIEPIPVFATECESTQHA